MHKTLSILFFCLISLNSFSQKYIAIDTVVKEYYYDYTIIKDSTDRSKENFQEMILQIGNKYSKFASTKKILSDSLYRSFENIGPVESFLKIWPKIRSIKASVLGKFVIYKDYPDKRSVRFIGKLGSKLHVEVKQHEISNWQYSQKADSVIMGLNCRKAYSTYGGRKWEAWYTSDINISNGPYKFGGLPGLIVMLSDTKNEHVFQLTKIKNCTGNQAMIFVAEKIIKETTPQGFTQAMDKYFKDLYVKFGGDPNAVYSNPYDEAKSLRNIRSINNFIEQY